MIAGMTLDTLGRSIVEQNAQKRDLVAPTRLLTFGTEVQNEAVVPKLHAGDYHTDLTDHATKQLVSWAGIPTQYAERMKTLADRDLLTANVNHWLTMSNDKRLVRTFDMGENAGITRAFLSPRYRPLDNYDLLERVLPKIRQPGYELRSCALTETRLYLQVVSERITAEVKWGDIVQAGVVISNSEVGSGRIKVEPMVYRLVCTNGLISGVALRKNHVGRGFGSDDDEGISEYFSDETRQLDDAAFWAKLSDVIDAAFDAARFQQLVAKLRVTADVTLPAAPDAIMDVTAKKLDLTQAERDAALLHLFQGGDATMYGLVNAITRTAEDATSYDRAVELERLGGTVLEWKAADLVPPSAN